MDLALLLGVGSGLLLVALGAWVLARRPRRRENVAFGVFAAGWGAGHVAFNVLLQWESTTGAGLLLTALFGVIAGTALIRLALLLPAPVTRGERGTVALAAAAALVADLPLLVHFLRFEDAWFGDMRLFAHATTIGWGVLRQALWFTLVLGALRYRRFGTQERLQAGGVLVSQAVAVYAVLIAGTWGIVLASLPPDWKTEPWWWSVIGVVMGMGITILLLVGLWAYHMVVSPRPRGPRNALLMILASLLAGAAAETFGWDGTAGALRLVAVALLAYAILRHQLLDIDVKVKWTLKQSTVAAIFIAVFFIVSEGAAAVFEAQTGSTVAGILAAGGLVFAIAPLQRLADRLAETAMPGVNDTTDHLERRKREIYAAAVASAARDGVITEAERDVLATLADELGLKAGEARALEREALGPTKEATP